MQLDVEEIEVELSCKDYQALILLANKECLPVEDYLSAIINQYLEKNTAFFRQGGESVSPRRQ